MSRTGRPQTVRNLVQILLATALFVVVLNAALGELCEFVIARSSLRFSVVAEGKVNTDLVVIGNSRGVNLIAGTLGEANPRIFNLSYNSLGRRSSIALAKQFFASGNKAHYVVFETSALWMFGNTSNCELKTYWRALSLLAREGEERCRDDFWAGRYFPLTIYNTELFLRVAYYALIHRQTDQDWVNGYVMTDAACRHLQRAGDNRVLPPDTSLVSVARADVADLRKWMAMNVPGTKLVFVTAPFFDSPPMSAVVRQYAALTDRILGKGTYLDLGTVLGDDCRLFADSYHIIGAGRAAVRQRILDSVRAM
jgi:hypothetical protein